MNKQVTKYQSGLKGLQNELPNIIRQILKDNWSIVFKILTDEQLGKGTDSKGKIIGTYKKITESYAADPENRARKPKEAGKPYNFEWTGGTFDELFLTFDSLDTYTLFSHDSKATFLKDTYGDIFDFTKAHNERINFEIVLPELDKKLEQFINKI